jgi:hypothetical protein
MDLHVTEHIEHPQRVRVVVLAALPVATIIF